MFWKEEFEVVEDIMKMSSSDESVADCDKEDSEFLSVGFSSLGMGGEFGTGVMRKSGNGLRFR